MESQEKTRRPQVQNRSRLETKMEPYPQKETLGSGKLKNKVAFITGSDSGIGRTMATNFAKGKAVMPHLKLRSSITNLNIVDEGIQANAVAPVPILSSQMFQSHSTPS